MCTRVIRFGLACALALALAPAAQAARFDLIHVERFDLTLCDVCGITLAGTDFALLVNEGTTDIEEAELSSASFVVTSSRPDFALTAFINDPVPPMVAPIQPQEAVGSVTSYLNSAVLLTLLQPGEVHRNTAPAQFLAFQVERLAGDYEGPVQFNVSLTLGAEEVQFVMIANVRLGQHDIQFTSAARTSSVPLPTDAARTSWGAIKSLYR